MQPTIAQKFRDRISNFLHSPENLGKFTHSIRARVFIDEAEPNLARLFLLDQTERLFRLEERLAERKNEEHRVREDPQLRLLGPGFAELFGSVRERLPLKTGKRVILDLATVSQIRESAVVIRIQARKRATRNTERDERRAKYLEGLADAMSPYAQVHRKINFRDFRELAAAGIGPGTKKQTVKP
jgi:hypothetical protein